MVAIEHASLLLSKWTLIVLALSLLIIGYKAFKIARYQLILSKIPKWRRHKGLFGAWEDAREYRDDSARILREGYERYSKHGQWYQLSTPTRWVTVIPPKSIEEIRAVSENVLSSQAALADILQTRHLVSPIVEEQKFHFAIVKSHVTPNLEVQVTDIMDEMQRAFADEIGSPKEFRPIVMAHAAHRITTRTANRMLVGAPLCRNEEYLDMTVKYTTDLFGGADRVRAYPDTLKGLLSRYTTNIHARQDIARKHLIPYITARLEQENHYQKLGKIEEWRRIQPQDSLQWIINAAPNGKEREPDRLMLRVLHLNVTAVHTTSVTFLNCMFDLAYRPEIIPELREEVVKAVSAFGWTKKGLNEMKKIDSFMVESQRVTPMSSTQMTRGVLKDITLSDGTTLPAGSWVFAPMEAMYHDPTLFPDPERFDHLRSWRKRGGDSPNEAVGRHQFVSTSASRISFGHGNAACPGRFFAANEIKMMLAHVLLRYDVVLEHHEPPKPRWYDRTRIPNLGARVLFKARETVEL
ncbi:cytochrome P450 [Lophiotrema nucula]|uniref:Cytochrome P450 n=1 Tax=Lophiotrema nucula TaxID=690887 RepID=A0A6A5YSC5_9PLEO|nr:cytochrome P450 [Lophiotrema nucula]